VRSPDLPLLRKWKRDISARLICPALRRCLPPLLTLYDLSLALHPPCGSSENPLSKPCDSHRHRLNLYLSCDNQAPDFAPPLSSVSDERWLNQQIHPALSCIGCNDLSHIPILLAVPMPSAPISYGRV